MRFETRKLASSFVVRKSCFSWGGGGDLLTLVIYNKGDMTTHIVKEYQCYNVGTKCYQYTAVKVSLIYRRNYWG